MTRRLCNCTDPDKVSKHSAHAGWCAIFSAWRVMEAEDIGLCATCGGTGMVSAMIETATGMAACPYLGEPCRECTANNQESVR